MTVCRRFLLAPSFARLIRHERGGLRHVEGFFVSEQRDRSSLVRLEEYRGVLVIKTAYPHGDVEEQADIPAAHAHALLDVCAAQVDYIRTVLPIGEGHALVDEIIRPYPLHLVTLEFASDKQAKSSRPLKWFGPEVTADRRYTNQTIALQGFDEAPEIPPNDAALNSLIDTLEGRLSFRAQNDGGRTGSRQPSLPMASAQVNERVIKADLAEVEQAMRREMERTLQRSRSG